MTLKAIYDSQDEIPEVYRDLYTARNGKFELTGIEGIKTQADVDRVSEALRKEKTDHGVAKESLRKFTALGVAPEDIQAKLDNYDELEVRANSAGKLNEEQIEKIVTARVKTAVTPIERENLDLKKQNGEFTTRITDFEGRERTRLIHESVREARKKVNALEDAEPDILLNAERMLDVDEAGNVVTKDGVGVTPGVAADVWLLDMQAKRSIWWPASEGGGARGGKVNGFTGKNPWAKETLNLTEQGRIYNENPERAKQLAQAAGVEL
jgi:hypothetical protein